MESDGQGRPKLTAKGERTRARIVAEVARLIYEHGVAGTKLDDVRAAAVSTLLGLMGSSAASRHRSGSRG